MIQKIWEYRFKGISLCVVLVLTVGYYSTPNAIDSIDIVVVKTLLLYTGWLELSLGYDNRIMNNKFTNYISNLSMEMYLSHMVVFRIIEKTGITGQNENSIIRYMATYILLVALLVTGLTIYKRVTKDWVHLGESMSRHLSIEETIIKGLYIINPTIYRHDEYLVFETYNKQEWMKDGLDMNFVQENQSISGKGVLRGLHVQKNSHKENWLGL